MLEIRGIPQTLLVPLACRALESEKSDALLRDWRSMEVYRQLAAGQDCLMGMSALDQTFTVMRARQFDRIVRRFLAIHPNALVVDIGCGLDTRFDRLDNSQLAWLGLDLPEVISLRQAYLPDADRCRSLACSLFDLRWLEIVSEYQRPAIFLAEGVFPYLREAEILPLLRALATRYPGCELVFDALTSFSIRMHNRTSSVLKQTGARLEWAVDRPRTLEPAGLHLIDQWGYFDKPEPRLGLARLLRYLPLMNKANRVLHYRLRS